MSKSNGDKPNPREVKLSDGRKLIVNLNELTWRDVREYVQGVPSHDPEHPEAASEAERRHAELKGRACGLSTDDVLALGFEDFSLIGKKISDIIVDPIGTDENLAKASTSPETGEHA